MRNLSDQYTLKTLLTVPTVDGHAVGPTTSFVVNYNGAAVGDLVAVLVTGELRKASADPSVGIFNHMLGILLEAKLNGQSALVALPGSMVYTTNFPTFTVGAPIYMSETAGALTNTQPVTTDAVIRVIGWGIHADKMYFYPSQDYITHT